MKWSVALLILLLPPLALAENYPARVVGISDGDTLTVRSSEKKQVKIRLSGIEAPGTVQDFGGPAKQAASELLFGKNVTVQVRDKDRYGQTVAEVILPDGKSRNREMVGLGLAAILQVRPERPQFGGGRGRDPSSQTWALVPAWCCTALGLAQGKRPPRNGGSRG
jgi:micrococcal nuclease